MYGKATGCTGGKGGSMHLVVTPAGVTGTSAVVGTTIANAVGYAYAEKYQCKDTIVACFFGDGATEEGVFYESLNFAVLKKLPVMFICENNGYAIHTPQSKRQGVPDIAQRAKAFGVTTTLIEDNNALKLHEATNQAVSDIRSGEATGPYLFECRTYRWKEHVGPGEDWHLGFRTLDEAQPWVQNDQVGRIGELISTEARTAIEAEVEAELAEAIEFAENSPFPEEAELFTDVYSTPNAPLEARKAA